jgi:hypothetical protein
MLSHEEICMRPPITLYLIGFAGTGKYTIAKEVTKSGYKLIDNHLINNPIFSLLDLDGVTPISEKAWDAIEIIRKAILGFISQDFISCYVLTNELEEGAIDHMIYDQVKEAAEKRGSLFIPVKLSVSLEEHKRRITNPDRLLRFKTTHSDKVYTKNELIQIDHPYLLEIDVTELSPIQAADHILSFVENVKNDL